MSNWSIKKLKNILPTRPFGKVHKDNVNARLIDVNRLVEDLNNILSDIENETKNPCDLTMKPQEVILGPEVTFTNPDGGTEVDYIDNLLELTRGGEPAFYNQAIEPNFGLGSPAGTFWNNDGWDDLTDIESRTYSEFFSVFVSEAQLVSDEWVMYDAINGKYYKFNFTQVASVGGIDTSYSYTRQLITLGKLCKLTFSDGTAIDTRPVGTEVVAGANITVNKITDFNGDNIFEIVGAGGGSWDMTGVAFVDPVNGNNATAVIGDGNKPYQFITTAANSGASKVFLLPGNYGETHTLVSGVIYYCFPGVIFTSGTMRSASSTLTNTKWLGYARFQGSANIDLRPTVVTNFVFQADSIITSGATGFYIQPTNLSNVQIDINYIDSTFGNSAAPMVNIRGNITGVVNIKKIVSYYKALQIRDITSPELVVNVDQLDVPDGGHYGNAGGFKHGLTVETVAAGSVLVINIGLSRNFTTTPLNCGNVTIVGVGANATVKCKVDYAESVANPLIYTVINSVDSVIELEVNGYSLNRAFYLSSVGILNIKNSTFRQNLESLAGAGVECYLSNCTFYSDQAINAINMNNAASKVYMNGVGTEGDPAAYFITGVAGSTYGLNNVVSTQLLDAVTPTNAYGFVGWNVEPNYKAPKFK